jgi:hypothetical protein
MTLSNMLVLVDFCPFLTVLSYSAQQCRTNEEQCRTSHGDNLTTKAQGGLDGKKSGKIIHREAQTFDRRQAAVAWLKRRETVLSEPGAIDRAKVPDKSLADAIDRYSAESRKAIGRTKAQVLASIKEYDIANLGCGEIRSDHIVGFASELLAGGRQPATVGNYISHLAAIFAIARPLGAIASTKSR